MLFCFLINSAIGSAMLLGGLPIGLLFLFVGCLCGIVWIIDDPRDMDDAHTSVRAANDVAYALRARRRQRA